jgi:K+-H+ exchange-related protein
MDVYLLPIGTDVYELYCEEIDESHDVTAELPKGFVRRLKHRFTSMLSEAERERRQGRADREAVGWLARLKARMLRWVAESIAEQRLLWHLRNQTSVAFFYPDDMDEPHAHEILRRQLTRDFEKHRFWLIVDSFGFVASGLLFFVPGPNVIAYYFGFRIFGHYLSLRGARQGLREVSWAHRCSPPLSELRRVIDLDPTVREQRVQDVALALQLEHLATFFQRTAIP